jgi:hypothetical protein
MDTKITVRCYEPSQQPQGGWKPMGLEKIFNMDQDFSVSSSIAENGKITHKRGQNYVNYERIENGSNCSTKYFLCPNVIIYKETENSETNKDIIFVLNKYSEQDKIKIIQRRI